MHYNSMSGYKTDGQAARNARNGWPSIAVASIKNNYMHSKDE